MMRLRNCRWVRRQRWRYLDHTLRPTEQAEVEQHLSACVPCRAVYAEAQLALEMLKKGQSLPPELKKKLLPERRGWAVVLGRLAVITVVLAAVGYGVLRLHGARLVSEAHNRAQAPQTPTVSTVETPSVVSPATPDSPPNRTETNRPPLSKRSPPNISPHPKATVPAPRQVAPKKRPIKRPRSLPKPVQKPSRKAPPPEGTVEIYDTEGNLLHRRQIPEVAR